MKLRMANVTVFTRCCHTTDVIWSCHV